MIPRKGATLSIEQIPVERIILGTEHGMPIDRAQVEHYLSLLEQHPHSAPDPVVVEQFGWGIYIICNGRHRFLAAVLNNEPTIAAVVIRKEQEV